jgi:hypothetical protein
MYDTIWKAVWTSANLRHLSANEVLDDFLHTDTPAKLKRSAAARSIDDSAKVITFCRLPEQHRKIIDCLSRDKFVHPDLTAIYAESLVCPSPI